MRSAILHLDSSHRVLHSTYYAPCVTAEDVVGKLIWECVAMTPESRQSIRTCIEQLDADGQPHSYTLEGQVGIWRTTVYPCKIPPVAAVLFSRQMPPELARLTPEQREFCRLTLDRDSKQLAKELHCSLQTVSYKRAAISRKLSVDPADLRCHLAAYRFWLE